jgi:hypothetical protein
VESILLFSSKILGTEDGIGREIDVRTLRFLILDRFTDRLMNWWLDLKIEGRKFLRPNSWGLEKNKSSI